MSIPRIASLLALSLSALGCGSKALDLDAAVIEASSEPGVLGVVRERVQKLVVDEQRLYWASSRLPSGVSENAWFLRSCQKNDCAATLVTYDAQAYPTDANFAILSQYPNDQNFSVFSVIGEQIYWFRLATRELLACPVVGCNGSTRVVASGLNFSAAAFDEQRFYFFENHVLSFLPLLKPGPRLSVVDPGGPAAAVAIHDEYAYLLGEEAGGIHLYRTPKAGMSGIETVATDVRYSSGHAFGITTDPTSIYWTNNLLAGSINRCPLAGCTGASELVLAPLRAPQNLLIDGSELYYQYEARPYEYALASCTLPTCAPSLPLMERLAAPGAMALDDQYLYLATTEQDVSPNNVEVETTARIRRLPKPNR